MTEIGANQRIGGLQFQRAPIVIFRIREAGLSGVQRSQVADGLGILRIARNGVLKMLLGFLVPTLPGQRNAQLGEGRAVFRQAGGRIGLRRTCLRLDGCRWGERGQSHAGIDEQGLRDLVRGFSRHAFFEQAPLEGIRESHALVEAELACAQVLGRLLDKWLQDFARVLGRECIREIGSRIDGILCF